ncbi:hypothetical protein FRC17_010199, partial [Serendipita sp. 399]
MRMRATALLMRHATTNSARRVLDTPNSQTHELPHMMEHHVKSPGLETAMAGAKDLPGSTINPYKDGPSALDKVMTMFLFTELVR